MIHVHCWMAFHRKRRCWLYPPAYPEVAVTQGCRRAPSAKGKQKETSVKGIRVAPLLLSSRRLAKFHGQRWGNLPPKKHSAKCWVGKKCFPLSLDLITCVMWQWLHSNKGVNCAIFLYSNGLIHFGGLSVVMKPSWAWWVIRLGPMTRWEKLT